MSGSTKLDAFEYVAAASVHIIFLLICIGIIPIAHLSRWVSGVVGWNFTETGFYGFLRSRLLLLMIAYGIIMSLFPLANRYQQSGERALRLRPRAELRRKRRGVEVALRGMIFDFMEHFEIRLTDIRMNFAHYSFVGVSFVFRLYCAVIVLNSLIACAVFRNTSAARQAQ